MRVTESNEAALLRNISRLAGDFTDLKKFLYNALGEVMRAFECDAGFFHGMMAHERSICFLSKGLSRKTAALLRNAPEESFANNKSGALDGILLKEPLINCLRGMKRKAHGAQEPRHINRIVEVASTAQRSDSPAQAINQRFLKEGLQSFVLHPIRAENQVIGHIGLVRKEGIIPAPGVFFSVCLEILGMTITKAWLREQSDKLHDDLAAMQGLNKITTHGFDIDEIIQRIVVHGKRLVKSNNCHLFLIDDAREHMDRMASTQTGASDTHSIRLRIADAPAIIMDALQKRRGIAIENLEKHYDWYAGLPETLKWRSIIVAPMLAQDQVIGALICSDETACRRFTDNEVLRVEMLAHQAAIALENALLFQAVSRSQKSWETTFDAMQDCVSVHDTTGKIVRANLALARRLKTTPRLVVGRYCSEIYNPSAGGRKYCRHILQGKPEEVVTEEVELPAMNGFFQISISPWYDKNNQIAGFIHVAKDISNEKLLQQQLIQSEKLSAIGELISGIAHELNNPLTGVMGYSQLLQLRKDMDDRARESLSKINSLAERCQKIVQNLLSFARKKKSERSLSDINEILNKTLDLRNYEMQVNNIELISELEPGLPVTIADAHQLQQVFLNIITNAEQAMLSARGRGRLTIRTSSKHRREYITVEIVDNGPGIPEKYKTRIFDPFFTTKDVGNGTGLGLSLSYGIIKEHGGDIFVKKRSGGDGAHFFIEIPIVRENEDSPIEPHELIPDEHRFKDTGRIRKILVVDDEKYILDFLTEVFRLLPFSVDTAEDSQTALNKIQSCEYDLVITDYKMPRMSGGSLFNWVKGNRPSLVNRIVFMTGDTVNPETHSFFKNNQIRFLTKPFKIEEIKEMVAKTLEDSQ